MPRDTTDPDPAGAGDVTPPAGEPAAGHSRRAFLRNLGLTAGAAAVLPALDARAEAPAAPPAGIRDLGRGRRRVTLTVNGQARTVEVEPRTTLLAALRDQLGLTGAKEVCDRGACGACSVLVDGVSQPACMRLAVDVEGAAITTAEGLADDPAWAPLVDAFCDHDAAQCGFCIPGFLVRSAALVDEAGRRPLDRDAIREGLSGNLCRCGTYEKLFDAVADASRRLAPGGGAKGGR